MKKKIHIDTKDIKNPFLRSLIAIFAILLAGGIVALVLFIVLPLVGVAVTFSIGLVGIVLIVLGIGLPVLILAGTIFGAIMTPFIALARAIKRKTKRRDIPIEEEKDESEEDYFT